MSKAMTPTQKKPAGRRAKRVPEDLVINRRREWRFELPLTARVKGRLPEGQDFEESCTLANISSGGAYFCLDSGVVVGSKLNVVIDLPPELAEGQPLRLALGGITIRLEKPDSRAKKQGVAVRFDKRCRFIREDS